MHHLIHLKYLYSIKNIWYGKIIRIVHYFGIPRLRGGFELNFMETSTVCTKILNMCGNIMIGWGNKRMV